MKEEITLKKLTAAILTPALILSLNVTAFAATNDGTEGTQIEVNGTFTAADAPSVVVSADVT